jgi:transcription antitermination factor NusG
LQPLAKRDGEALSWYAVYCRSRHEKVVRDELTSKGIENLLPSFTETRRWADRHKAVVERPLFPGYLFARFCAPRERIAVLSVIGVSRIIGFCGEIAAIPDEQVEAVRQLLASVLAFAAAPMPQIGNWVRVVRGPLAGVEGKLVRMKSQDRLVLAVDLIAQAVSTEVDLCDVEPLYGRSAA